jgi:type IV pilus biogenesis protein CpaD/CtpE
MQKTFKTTPVLALLAVMTLGALAGCTETQGTTTSADQSAQDVPNMRATIENPM